MHKKESNVETIMKQYQNWNLTAETENQIILMSNIKTSKGM